VHQPVDLLADVHEDAEVRHVLDHPSTRTPRGGGLQLVPRVGEELLVAEEIFLFPLSTLRTTTSTGSPAFITSEGPSAACSRTSRDMEQPFHPCSSSTKAPYFVVLVTFP